MNKLKLVVIVAMVILSSALMKAGREDPTYFLIFINDFKDQNVQVEIYDDKDTLTADEEVKKGGLHLFSGYYGFQPEIIKVFVAKKPIQVFKGKGEIPWVDYKEVGSLGYISQEFLVVRVGPRGKLIYKIKANDQLLPDCEKLGEKTTEIYKKDAAEGFYDHGSVRAFLRFLEGFNKKYTKDLKGEVGFYGTKERLKEIRQEVQGQIKRILEEQGITVIPKISRERRTMEESELDLDEWVILKEKEK